MKVNEVAKYYLAKASADGDLITNLKMQKLIYYAYVWVLVNTKGEKLFLEPIEAWANGPVVASLYQELKDFGSMPIPEEYIGDPKVLVAVEQSPLREILDNVYERYMPKAAFELVGLTHSEAPWIEGRLGKSATESGSVQIKDETILSFYQN